MKKLNVSDKIKKARLYCSTCPPKKGQTYETMVEQACRGGADVIQMRDKNLSAKEMVILAKKLVQICHRYEALFIVNDRLDVAFSCGADGVHLGQEDLPLEAARKIVDTYIASDFIIGCSTHSLEQALKAQAEGADYLGCGPIFSTPTKPNVPAVGLELIAEYKQKIKIPFVAIGGIDKTNLRKVMQEGAECVAVVRAAFESNDIESAVRSLKKQINQSE